MPMGTAEVSIVMPFADHEHLVGRAARRIAEYFRSTGMHFEIIAVDRGAGDNSQPVLQLLRKEMPELRIIVGRSCRDGVRKAQASVVVLLSPEQAAGPLSESLSAAVQQVASGELEMSLLDENLLVCAASSCAQLLASAPLPRHKVERNLLRRARRRGLRARSYGPEEARMHPRGIRHVLSALVPRSTGLHRAW